MKSPIQKYVFAAVLVLLCTAAVHAAAADEWQKAGFVTRDGVRIQGLYRAPAKKGAKFVVFLHGLGSNKGEWVPLMKELSRRGHGYFSYDARGHGDSGLRSDGTAIDYRTFGEPRPGSDWAKMPLDLDDAVNYLVQEKHIPAGSIGCAGASVGANVCLAYAAAHPAASFVVLLSPGINYAGITTDNLIAGLAKRPLLIAAASNDPYAWKSSRWLYEHSTGNRAAVFLEGKAGHGTQMFNGAIERDIVSWMEKH